ncbi:hypothetical protein BCR37DRAFT_394790 [Protomyces lactucae-debilis]|uniref:RED-like N-terminal domain-containing protein n=1 Tax=Protomyces lactucae-debilis TaxID=2754530 RepID=A0A1Y2F1G9_PROLT|nr:uncharacterized protein BCR37DRAFT_394790 [Protomyces lactucae-debilis]ORY77700.1 hypothetical protein BCR37DRAFT_394790 [Protomyces lactucae-debilis]
MKQDDFRHLVNQAGQAHPNKPHRTSKSTSAVRAGLLPRTVAKHSASRENPFGTAGDASFKKPAQGPSSKNPRYNVVRHAEASTPEEIVKLKLALEAKEITYEEYVDRVARVNISGDLVEAGKARGLDRQLLARVKAGEDVLASPSVTSAEETVLQNEDPKKIEDPVDEEAALEAAFDETLMSTQKQEAATTDAGPLKHRDALLLKLRQRAPESANNAAVTMASKPSKFRSITVGPTTEVIEKDGQKIKIVRDASGKVIKRLVKKVQKTKSQKPAAMEKVVDSEKQKPTAPAEVTVAILPPADDEDIFADAGEYDPFAIDPNAPIKPIKGKLFADIQEEIIDASPVTAANFLEQNKDRLMDAQALTAKQPSSNSAKDITEEKRIQAGFGLVLDADAYDGGPQRW